MSTTTMTRCCWPKLLVYASWQVCCHKLLLVVCLYHVLACQVIEHELEFISKQAKGQQTKGQARQRRYEELVEAANSYVRNTQVGEKHL